MTGEPSANPDKRLEIVVDGVEYQRIPIRTRLLLHGEDLTAFVVEHAGPIVREGDLLFVSEKIVAIAQGRAYPVDSIRPRRLAAWLSRHVTKTSHGIGLGMPETMEMALREVGTPRILLAAAVSVVSKALGRTGDFYRVAGPKARGIDGPTEGTIPPFNSQVVLVPERPDRVAAELKAALGVGEVAIVDVNDFGANILGATIPKREQDRLALILADNPLGQGHESTPLGVVRPAPGSDRR